MFGFGKKKGIGLKDKPEVQESEEEKKMLWEITDEIIERADQNTIDNWDRNLEEARQRLGITQKTDSKDRAS